MEYNLAEIVTRLIAENMVFKSYLQTLHGTLFGYIKANNPQQIEIVKKMFTEQIESRMQSNLLSDPKIDKEIWKEISRNLLNDSD